MDRRNVRRWAATGALTSLVVTLLAVPTLVGPAGAAPATAPAASKAAAANGPPVTIGVDNAPPPGKNWTYTHYFPESNVSVPAGGIVLFAWNQGSLNGLHSVTFVPNGQTVAQARAVYPTLASDTDNGESGTIIPPLTNNPTNPACEAGPGAAPCVFDGTSVLNSGVIPTSTGAVFPVQIAPQTAAGTYTYFCSFHPGMQGTLTVVPAGQPATDAATVASQAAAELNQLNSGAVAAEAAASVPTSTANADGTSTWTVHVGLTVDDVELLEYLPTVLPIRKGDSVKYDGSGTTQEPHTVTSGAAAAQGMIPFGQNQCESASGPDTSAANVNNGPPQTGCADPGGFEQPLNLHSQGVPSVLTSGDTSATSAVVTGRADIQAAGAEASHTYTFANNGTYTFFCVFHQNMAGIVSTPGYRVGTSNGGIYTFGAADFFGSKAGSALPSPVVATPGTFDSQGYWLVTADGHTYNYGAAASVGDVPAHLASPIVGAAPTPDNGGLWLVAKDGGVFALGDAAFMGSMGGQHLNSPIVGISGDSNGMGYDLAAADGGVFNFGTSGSGGPRYLGSMGGQHLNSPVVAILDKLGGGGYWLAAADGGVFTFGSAPFVGSLGATHLAAPIVSMASAFPGRAYRLGAADGGVFTFGAAPFFGSAVPDHPSPVVGIMGEA
jgi:plastocyanin